MVRNTNLGSSPFWICGDLATAADLRVPAIEAVSARMTELCATGLGGLDYCAVAKPYEPGPTGAA